MYLLTAGSARCADEAAAAAGERRSWWFELGSFGTALYTSRAKRASSPSRRGTSNATLRGEGLRRPLLAASLRVDVDVRGSKAGGFPIRVQNRNARQSLSESRARSDAAAACSWTLRVSSTGMGSELLRRCGAAVLSDRIASALDVPCVCAMLAVRNALFDCAARYRCTRDPLRCFVWNLAAARRRLSLRSVKNGKHGCGKPAKNDPSKTAQNTPHSTPETS